MGTLMFAGAIAAGVIWLLARRNTGGQSATLPPPSSGVPPRPRAPSPESTTVTAPKKHEADFWIPPNQSISIAGAEIHGGMLYVGTALASVSRHMIEPALIDPNLPIDRRNPDHAGTGMPYWPSYQTISGAARAAYLDWLASGRRKPNTNIGYVFLFLYGLERRVFGDAVPSEELQRDLPGIRTELEELLQAYGSNHSFRRYASQLLELVQMLGDDAAELTPSLQRAGYELPLLVRAVIGGMVAAGRPIPVGWAMSWYLTHPETVLRTPITRCPDEYRQLFHLRYRESFGDGLLLKPNNSKLTLAIRPASASFGGPVRITTNVPDIGRLSAPLAKLRRLGDECSTDLDAFSRWVGRNDGAPRTIAAAALLPAELARTQADGEARELWRWIDETVSSTQFAVCRTELILDHCKSFGTGKLAKKEGALLAQLLENGGYGIEPDVRFGSSSLAPGGKAVIFRLPAQSPSIASPQYAAATVLLHFAVAVSHADGSISAIESRNLEQHVANGLQLSDGERVRLSAHLEWLKEAPPGIVGLKKRVEPLGLPQRSAIATFIVSVAGADGHLDPAEIKLLGKLYPILGLQPEDVYSHVHSMAAGGATPVNPSAPVTLLPAQPAQGYSIPNQPRTADAVTLNMISVQSKLVDSAKISAILSDIFTDNTPVAPLPPSESQKGRLRASQAGLLQRLAERGEWTREEFDALATEFELLPDAAFDALNELAFEHADMALLEGDDKIEIDVTLARELLV